MDPRALLDGNLPVSAADLAALAEWSPAPLPAEYVAALRVSDGGHATRSAYPTYLRFWPARTVIEYNRDYEVQRWVPGLIGFGDDGGPTFLAFDTRRGPPYSVVVVPFASMEFAAAEIIAGNFAEFVGQLLPREPDTEPGTAADDGI
jgi:hypothetical protein